MSSTCSTEVQRNTPVNVIYDVSTMISSSSSEDQFESWAQNSIRFSENSKAALYSQGLYDPGSGEICAKYITMSDSAVLRHPYYNYPGVKDPGIRDALLKPEPKKTYSLDGQQLYLDLCKEMRMIPVRSFYRGLLQEVVDLKYYGVNPNGVRAMAMALSFNWYVRRLDLTSNFLNEDACYHLGQMLGDNITLKELILSGCRIRAEGVKRLVILLSTRPLDELDLSRNDLGDSGFEHLADQLAKGAVIKRLNLSYNGLTSISASAFANAIEDNKTITHLDLSWNRMIAVRGVNELLAKLGGSKVLVDLNLSWNSLKVSRLLRRLFIVPTLRILNLSNNKLESLAAKVIANSLRLTKTLHTLNLSFNPLTSYDAFLLVNKLRTKTIKITNLLMDNIGVNKDVVKECKEVLQLSFRKNCNITYGEVRHDYTITARDMRLIVMKRMDYLTSRASKKRHTDLGVYFLQKQKTGELLQPRDIMRDMKVAGTPLDEDVIATLFTLYPGAKLDKGAVALDVNGVVDMVLRLWPDKKLPPTPENEPEPEPVKKDEKKEDVKKKEDKKKK